MNITDICNIALNLIGRGSIASLDEDSEAARTCRLHYDMQRRILLRTYTWSFALRTDKLALLDVEVPGWEYAYAYPNDCVMARKIFNDENSWFTLGKNQKLTTDIVNINDNSRALVCHQELAYLQYTVDVKDANLFSDDFAQALAYYLAAAIALPLTGSATIAQQMQQQGAGMLAEAKFTMADERNRVPEYPSKYAKARW